MLDPLLEGPALAGAATGIYVVRLSDGAELYARGADVSLIPASNVKLLTTAAALRYLGPDYRFRTEVYGDLGADGVVTGDLVIKGYGDPYLVPERVWHLATRVFYAGVKEVRGNLIVDDSFFDGPMAAEGAERDTSSYAYMAHAGALSVSFNAIAVHVLPAAVPGENARILVEPPSGYALLQGGVSTTSRGRSFVNVDVEPYGDRSVVQLSGRIARGDPGRSYWRRVDNPVIFAGEVLRSTLERVGIKVRGRLQRGLVGDDVTRLVSLSSPPLRELVDRINKHSNNFMASQLAHTLGAERFGAPGSWTKGQTAIVDFLEQEVGVPRDSYELGNASGLHDVNRVSPRTIARLLEYMYRQPGLRPEYMASLAVAGGNGTLRDRMRDSHAAHQLRAKTGTLSTASALSGYVTTRQGDELAFSIIVNHYKQGLDAVLRVQDAIGVALAGLRGEGSLVDASSVAVGAPDAVGWQ